MRRLMVAAMLVCSWAMPAAAQQVDWSKKPLQSERSRAYDALHYRVAIRLDLDRKSFEGDATISLTSLTPHLQDVVLDAEEFTVSKVVSDWGEPLTFKQTEKELIVRWPEALTFGETRSFTVSYHGADPKAGLKFLAASGDAPQIVFSDSWPDHVHHWFPCFDYPNDKVTNEIVATVKTGLKVGANGRLVAVSENAAAGTVTYHWSQERPHSTYLIFLAAGPYVVVKDAYGTLPVNYWVYPQDAQKALPTYRKTPRMVEFFNRTFGYDYPWQKYDQVSVESGGGAESTSATAMTRRIMVDEAHLADYSADSIVSHELAHQWWGDLITLRSWAHTWLNESFATYSDYLYWRFDRGDDEGAVNLQGKLTNYLREAKTRYVRPIVTDRYDQPGDMFDAHTYPKGALVVHMLRNLLGDEAFFATLRQFLHRYAFEPVDTGDFIRSVKAVTGQNLDWFFDQWLYKPGHPVFDVRSDWDATRKVVTLKVSQVQDTSRGIPIFKVPVAVAVVTGAGKRTTTVWLREKDETIELPAETKPLMVRFDEGNVLIKEVSYARDDAALTYQLAHDDVIGRMEAAGELAGARDVRVAFDALAASAASDPFWAVRRSAAEALARLADDRATIVLKKICLDSHASVRAAALAALGERKDRSLVPFFRERFEKDASEAPRVEAVRALGKTGDALLVPILEKLAATPSFRDLVKNAAAQALKALGK